MNAYSTRIEKIQSFITKEHAKSEILKNKKVEAENRKKESEEWVENATIARDCINNLAQKTLGEVSSHIGQLVTESLFSVFENPYTFKIDFVNRRNQTECDLYVSRNNKDRHPLESNGGGLADIISSSLRSTFLVLSDLRPVLILDEPFKFLSEDLQSYCCVMLKTISEQLGIQVIMVSHLNEMKEIADSIINVKQLNGISSVEKVK